MIDTSAFQGKTAAYFTLGCKLNFDLHFRQDAPGVGRQNG